jgi:methionyl-tRNA synthetase
MFMERMDSCDIEGGAQIAIKAFRDVNGYLTEQAPWHMKGDDRAEERKMIVRATLEAVYALAHFLIPFIPVGASTIFRKLNTAPKCLLDLSSNTRNLHVGCMISIGDVLYSKVKILHELLLQQNILYSYTRH